MRRLAPIFALLCAASLLGCGREAPPAAPPPALPADLSAPPQETLSAEAPLDRMIDCAGAAAALAASDASAAPYRAVLAAALAKEVSDVAGFAPRIEEARARWAAEPPAAQAARLLVCQAEWPAAQP